MAKANPPVSPRFLLHITPPMLAAYSRVLFRHTKPETDAALFD